MNVLDEMEVAEETAPSGAKILTFTLKDRRRYRHSTLAHAPLDELAKGAFEALIQIEAEADRRAKQTEEMYAGVPLPKMPCGCLEKTKQGKKTLGIVSLGKALLGGAASPEVAAQRLAICQACHVTDPTGARLYRVINGKAYCGVPRLSDITKLNRDEAEWGCGCDLAWKAGMVEAGCPVGRW